MVASVFRSTMLTLFSLPLLANPRPQPILQPERPRYRQQSSKTHLAYYHSFTKTQGSPSKASSDSRMKRHSMGAGTQKPFGTEKHNPIKAGSEIATRVADV